MLTHIRSFVKHKLVVCSALVPSYKKSLEFHNFCQLWWYCYWMLYYVSHIYLSFGSKGPIIDQLFPFSTNINGLQLFQDMNLLSCVWCFISVCPRPCLVASPSLFHLCWTNLLYCTSQFPDWNPACLLSPSVLCAICHFGVFAVPLWRLTDVIPGLKVNVSFSCIVRFVVDRCSLNWIVLLRHCEGAC